MDEKINPVDARAEPAPNHDPDEQGGHEVSHHVGQAPPVLTLYQRVGGLKSVGLLAGALVVEMAAIGFVAYMEFGTLNNATWRRIVTTNNANVAFTLTSTVFQTCVATQGGILMSMLAAIALESISVPLVDSAKLWLLEIRGSYPYTWPMIRLKFQRAPANDGSSNKGETGYPAHEKGSRLFVVLLGLAVLATTTLLQFTSTLLVSDLEQQFLPGKNNSKTLLFDYSLTNAVPEANKANYYLGKNKERYGYAYQSLPVFSLWAGTMPAAWPAFAEYSEPPYVASGVSDTGQNLRAFLPLPAENRTSVRNYTGNAVVLDSRVTCQKPKTSKMTFSLTGLDTYSGVYLGNLFGLVSATKATPRMVMKPGYEVGASCIVTVLGNNVKSSDVENVTAFPSLEPYWTVCQLKTIPDKLAGYSDADLSPKDRAASGLLSEFRKPGVYNATGAAFLILASMDQLRDPDKDIGVDLGPDSPYAKIKLSDGAVDRSGFPANFGTEYAMTLCFASFDVAGRYVEAYSDQTRTEPSAKWDPSMGRPNMTDAVRQLDVNYPTNTGSGDKSNKSPPLSREERGILNLRPHSDWSVPPSTTDIFGPQDLPYVQGGFSKQQTGAGNMMPYLAEAMSIAGGMMYVKGTELDVDRPAVDYSAIFWQTFLETYSGGYDKITNYGVSTNEFWISSMFSRLSSRPSAFLQAMLTSIAGVAYYNRLEQYSRNTTSGLIAWESMDSPGGPFGTRRHMIGVGFLAVIIILLVHLALGAFVILRFSSMSKLTVVGDGWQAISHVAMSDGTKELLRQSNSSGSEHLVKGKGVTDILHGPLLQEGGDGLTKFKR